MRNNSIYRISFYPPYVNILISLKNMFIPFLLLFLSKKNFYTPFI